MSQITLDTESEQTRTVVTEQERTERQAADRQQCPECDGRVVTDDEHAETVCTECGLVVAEDEIDRGPEWRAFDSTERDEKARVGAPTTKLMHDKGLSSQIGWQNRDA